MNNLDSVFRVIVLRQFRREDISIPRQYEVDIKINVVVFDNLDTPAHFVHRRVIASQSINDDFH